jgi:hypothetical protein
MPKKPYQASIDQVKITRDGEYAAIDYADPDVGGMHLKVGSGIVDMSDQDILSLHNDVVAAMQASADEWEDVVVEIPVGKQQVLFHPLSDQWSPRGDVLRCLIDDTEKGQVTITIDEHEMTLTEFGRLLLTHAGWGMRIAFVPDDRTHINPEVEVREPDDDHG